MALLRFWLHLELNRMLRGTYTRPCAAEHDDLLLPHPRSISRADLARVRACPDEWTVAAKLDGVRALLVGCVFMGRRFVCAVGRRLDFLCQEFNRAANTLCSKSTDVALTRIGLDLKAQIDRLREQAANVE